MMVFQLVFVWLSKTVRFSIAIFLFLFDGNGCLDEKDIVHRFDCEYDNSLDEGNDGNGIELLRDDIILLLDDLTSYLMWIPKIAL